MMFGALAQRSVVERERALVYRGAREDARDHRNAEQYRDPNRRHLFWGSSQPRQLFRKCRTTPRDETDHSPLFEPWGEAMKKRRDGEAARAPSQPRVDADATRKRVTQKLACAEEAQAERPVTYPLERAENGDRAATNGCQESEAERARSRPSQKAWRCIRKTFATRLCHLRLRSAWPVSRFHYWYPKAIPER